MKLRTAGAGNTWPKSRLGTKSVHASEWSYWDVKAVIAVRLKIVHTDYDTAIVYKCHGLADDGRCRRELEQVDILCRRPVLDHLNRQRIYDVIKDRLCVDVYDFVTSARGQHSSDTKLDYEMLVCYVLRSFYDVFVASYERCTLVYILLL